jgi:hypothetical protein
LFLDELCNYFDDYVFRQTVKMELDRMQRPMPSPVIVQYYLHRLILVFYAIRK